MNQVIRNLISNALKFTPIGGKVKMQAAFAHSRSNSKEKGVAPYKKSLFRYIQMFNIISLIPFVPLLSLLLLPLLSLRLLSHRCALDLLRHSLQIQPVIASSVKGEHDQDQGDNGYPITGNLVIVITDTGAGMSEDQQRRLFKEIIQFNPEKLQAGGGSGLGLWITSGIYLCIYMCMYR
jgi:signal transduction histidine kinase